MSEEGKYILIWRRLTTSFLEKPIRLTFGLILVFFMACFLIWQPFHHSKIYKNGETVEGVITSKESDRGRGGVTYKLYYKFEVVFYDEENLEFPELNNVLIVEDKQHVPKDIYQRHRIGDKINVYFDPHSNKPDSILFYESQRAYLYIGFGIFILLSFLLVPFVWLRMKFEMR